VALLWLTVSYPRKFCSLPAIALAAGSSAVCLRVYSCPFVVLFAISVLFRLRQAYGATGFATIFGFIFCHLSFVMRLALAIGYRLLVMRFASFSQGGDWIDTGGAESG
jgi:hypothetical protein